MACLAYFYCGIVGVEEDLKKAVKSELMGKTWKEITYTRSNRGANVAVFI